MKYNVRLRDIVKEVSPMFDPNQPSRNTLAPYQPKSAEAQRMDDFAFRFGEGESLKGVWSVIRKRKFAIMVAG